MDSAPYDMQPVFMTENETERISFSVDSSKKYNNPIEVLAALNIRSFQCHIHWCAKSKDEVEKLEYQLNEEAERTERPIRRLSKVMYGSTSADMQVDVMGECLSSIKHVVGVRSVFLAKRLHTV
ncbi:uncharacterized protein TNCV_468241 [Trichonephila clavipes]|nr:uncharacterized protein TNCV_468241 [Trichonephila clavipes]